MDLYSIDMHDSNYIQFLFLIIHMLHVVFFDHKVLAYNQNTWKQEKVKRKKNRFPSFLLQKRKHVKNNKKKENVHTETRPLTIEERNKKNKKCSNAYQVQKSNSLAPTTVLTHVAESVSALQMLTLV